MPELLSENWRERLMEAGAVSRFLLRQGVRIRKDYLPQLQKLRITYNNKEIRYHEKITVCSRIKPDYDGMF